MSKHDCSDLVDDGDEEGEPEKDEEPDDPGDADEYCEADDIDDEEEVESIQTLQDKLKTAQCLADERYAQLMRCHADLDNVIRRTAKEKEAYTKFASESLVKKLLSIIDSLEQAAKHDEGSQVLLSQLMTILHGEGLEPIKSVGTKFDPYMHEAMMQVPSEDMDDDMVAQEFQKGYKLYSKVIRTSKVAVVKRK